MAFLPDNYQAPTKAGGHFFRPQDGKNRIRIVGSALVGYVGWDRSGDQPKPIRTEDRDGVAHLHSPDNKVKHFWAFPVIDRADDAVKIWEVTQTGIQDALRGLIDDADWGHPGDYDLIVTRSGQKLETHYAVMPAPKSPLDMTDEQKAVNAGINMAGLFTGDDPFAGAAAAAEEEEPF